MMSSQSIVSAFGRILPATNMARLVILIYHRVLPKRDEMFPFEIDAEAFDEQMAVLRKYFQPLSLHEAVTALRNGRLPPRAVAISFDDGYADNETVALPILRRHRLSATFFVSTGFLNGGRMWNDTVIESFRRCDHLELDLTEFGLGRIRIGHGRDRGIAALGVLRSIKHMGVSRRSEIAAAIGVRIGVSLPENLMMTSDQVVRLSAAGMEIGAHTVNHPMLSTLSDEEARFEIAGSRKTLVNLIGRPVNGFAYPNGRPGKDYGSRDRDLVESLEFDYAVSTQRGAASRDSDVFQLPRFLPWDRNGTKWLARLLLEYQNQQ